MLTPPPSYYRGMYNWSSRWTWAGVKKLKGCAQINSHYFHLHKRSLIEYIVIEFAERWINANRNRTLVCGAGSKIGNLAIYSRISNIYMIKSNFQMHLIKSKIESLNFTIFNRIRRCSASFFVDLQTNDGRTGDKIVLTWIVYRFWCST